MNTIRLSPTNMTKGRSITADATLTPGICWTWSANVASNVVPKGAVTSSTARPATVVKMSSNACRVVPAARLTATTAATPITIDKSVKIDRPGRWRNSRMPRRR